MAKVRKRIDELGSLQRAVMETLWRTGEATVHDVRDALAGSGDERTPAYTTVLTVLQKLEKAGWVRHRRDGRTYVYAPRRSREVEGRSSLRGFVNHVFRGDRLLLVQSLLSDDDIDEAELARIRRLIDERRKELGDA